MPLETLTAAPLPLDRGLEGDDDHLNNVQDRATDATPLETGRPLFHQFGPLTEVSQSINLPESWLRP